LHDTIRSGRSLFDDFDGKLLAIFDKFPFQSTHLRAERLLVTRSTVFQYFHESLGFKSFHLHCGPHQLTDDLREKQKEYAVAMWLFLHAAERTAAIIV
jgi:hypothetical protein